MRRLLARSSFSKHVVCNGYCRHGWARPGKQWPILLLSSDTTMVASAGASACGYHVPTRSSRPQMSAYAGYEYLSDDYY